MTDASRSLLSMLHAVSQLTRLEADRRARVHGMTLAQWRLLLQLKAAPGLTQKEVADLLEVEPISVARLVDRLAASRLIERRPDAEDRRVWRLHLLPKAAAALARIDNQLTELAGQVAAGMDAASLDDVMRALRLMKENLARGPVAAPVRTAARTTARTTVRETA